MSVVALSPVAAPEPPSSPMLTSVTPVTPTLELTGASVSPAPHSQDPDHRQSQDGASSPGSSGGFIPGAGDSTRRSKKPPPLHTGADWKVVLHLPEIETWLRATSDRVTQLTHSVGQDGDNRHVDVHLVQLKDICEDISDHVEQIHALLETEFSLKLLSYSVNIIVDIRTVQLLWHQLRVSVLVLKERLLQGLQDSNGNFTRQTDILQAFSQDQHQTRLDALTEVDDCGQLTIRCSQDYFSLDCGITAFELSDYSPGDEPEERGIEADDCDASQEEEEDEEEEEEEEPTQDSRPEPEGPSLSNQDLHSSLPELTTASDDLANHNHSPALPLPTMQRGASYGEGAKRRPPYGVSHSTEVSPTQPSLPKRAARREEEESRGGLRRVDPLRGLQVQAELSRSSPSLVDPPDRTKFWLELESVYPENVSQSYESLQVMNGRNLQRNHVTTSRPSAIRSEGRVQRAPTDQRGSCEATSSTAFATAAAQDGTSQQMERTQEETHAHSEGESDSSLPSPMKEQLFSSDLEASGEESDPRPAPGMAAVWIVKRQEQKQGASQLSQKTSPDREHWYGSEEFLALPAQLRKTEMLAMKLESLAHSLPLRPGDSEPDALQDVDDWDLTDWDVGDSVSCVAESGDENSSPLPPLLPYRRHLVSRLSPTSSSDIAPSVGESIESGPLSDLQSEEDEGLRESAARHLQVTVASAVDGCGRGRGPGVSLVQELLHDIQSQDKDPDIWRKIECFVHQLDGFILWLQESLDSTENWTQPRQELDSLRVYLDTHLSFKLDVDAHGALKENIVDEGRALLAVITCRQSGLKEILHMVSSQWDQLQRQIRRQHGWMLRALRCIQSRLLYTGQSQELFTASAEPPPPPPPPPPACTVDDLKAELKSSQCEAQRAALEQMVVKLSSLRYPSATSRRQYSQLPRNSNSLQDFEVEYQELWDWLMDMDAMVVDSHQLMMSEEQRHHLFKSSHTELMMMESRKSSLLSRAEALKRGGVELPGNFHCNIHNLTHTWNQLQKILSGHPEPASLHQNRSPSVNALLVDPNAAAAVENRRSALSPLTNSLLEQLETRIKELKVWLRDTELLIFNSCLRNDKDANDQLHSFKSLCAEVRARRRGVASVLKLCQKLLQQSQWGPMAEVGPEAEQHREALQLLSINLERRWEAIVMQALQWHNRLKRELGEQQVPGNFLEPGLVDLHHVSPVPAGPAALAPDDSWEWDETDLTIAEAEAEPREDPDPGLTQDLPTDRGLPPVASNQNRADRSGRGSAADAVIPHDHHVYQVYSLHTVELYQQPPLPLSFSSSLHKNKAGQQKRRLLLTSLSKDSSFSSMESLPDLLGGPTPDARGGGGVNVGGDGERGSGQSADSRRSECESGIVSDTETPVKKERGWRRSREEEKRRRHRRGGGGGGGGEAVEMLIDGRGLLTPADSDSDAEVGGVSVTSSEVTGRHDALETPAPSRRESSPGLSQSSSLESLLAAGVELFPSKDAALQRSASLESGLAPCRGGGASSAEVGRAPRADEEIAGNAHGGEASSGELSRRTLDLLKRLENIQSPLTANMTRSVSDMTLRGSSSPQRIRRIPASTSLGGRHAPLYGMSRRGPPSMINESSATASLTELSSTEDSSLASEDFAGCRHILDTNAANANSGCYRKRCHGNGQSGNGAMEEADAASLSMVVNVSACTDEDDDDSDLLSSSTLTLTEEELGVRDEEDEEEEAQLSDVSSGNEDSDEDEMEGSYILGLEDIRSELQSWIRAPPRTSSKGELGLRDELQCGPHLTSSFTCSSSSRSKQLLSRSTKDRDGRRTKRGGEGGEEEEEESRRNRSYMSRFVDDVENGNVDQSSLRRKEEDDELLREEASVFMKRGEPQREAYLFAQTGEEEEEEVGGLKPEPNSSSSTEVFSFPPVRASSLVGQLQGELPCHSSAPASPPSLSPVDDCRPRPPDALHKGGGSGGRKAITIQEKFKFSSFVTEETKREVRDKDKDTPPRPKRQRGCHASCPAHLHTSSSSLLRPRSTEESREENVHNFVMEIIDMTSLALKTEERESLALIRDKVLEHSHRPLHLRKGDFYSYLSLSSHDSDCGEVSQCSEEKSSTPAPPYSLPTYASPTPGLLHSPSPDMFTSTRQKVASSSSSPRSSPHSPSPSLLPSPDIRDEETLFSACTEEVYLGPPLCYSMALSRRQRTLLLEEKPRAGDPSDQELLYFQGSSPTHNSSSSSSSSHQTSRNPPPPPPPPPGEDLHLLCDVTGGEVAAAASVSNEAPPYLNPRACVASSSSSSSSSSSDQCLADTKTLESNMDAVMTEISDRGSETNPSKEPTATSINPKINSSPMRDTDTEERRRGGEGEARQVTQEEKRRRGRSNGPREVKTVTVKQVSSPSAVNHVTRAAQGRSQASARHAPSRTAPIRRLPLLGASRIHL